VAADADSDRCVSGSWAISRLWYNGVGLPATEAEWTHEERLPVPTLFHGCETIGVEYFRVVVEMGIAAHGICVVEHECPSR